MNAPGKTKWLHIATWSKQKSEKQFKQIKAQQKTSINQVTEGRDDKL